MGLTKKVEKPKMKLRIFMVEQTQKNQEIIFDSDGKVSVYLCNVDNDTRNIAIIAPNGLFKEEDRIEIKIV